MSKHDDLIRRLYAAWNEGGPDAMARDFWHRDIVWRDDISAPDRAEHFGAGATARYLNDVIETIGSVQATVHGAEETTDGALVDLTIHAQGQRSGASTDMRIHHLLKIEDDRVTDCQVFFDPEAAHAAARERGAASAGGDAA